MTAYRKTHAFAIGAPLANILAPGSQNAWLGLLSVIVFGVLVGLATAATLVARRGVLDKGGNSSPA
jgi:hypothetical protein